MRVKALKQFPYSSDGVALRDVSKGEEFDCREDLYEGLLAEKFIEPAVAKKSGAKGMPAPAATEIESAGEKA